MWTSHLKATFFLSLCTSGYQQPNFVGTVSLAHLIGSMFLIVHSFRRNRLRHLETLRFKEKLQAKTDTEITITIGYFYQLFSKLFFLNSLNA